MRPGPTTLGKTPLLPILAVVVSFFLVAGQVFNCCRLNESLSASIAKALEGGGPWNKHPGGASEINRVKTHSGCHGHQVSGEPEVSGIPLEDAPIRWTSAEACLSELDAVPVAIQPSLDPVPYPFFAASWVPAADLIFSRPRIEKPRPRNKSSPPVYLLTLRLLV